MAYFKKGTRQDSSSSLHSVGRTILELGLEGAKVRQLPAEAPYSHGAEASFRSNVQRVYAREAFEATQPRIGEVTA